MVLLGCTDQNRPLFSRVKAHTAKNTINYRVPREVSNFAVPVAYIVAH